MAEFLLELFSEEIPARMQQGAAEQLRAMLTTALAPLSPQPIETLWGPRRIAAVFDVMAEIPASEQVERGPRTSAPEAALTGFLRKHAACRAQLAAEGDYWVLRTAVAVQPASEFIAAAMPNLLRRFAWPKSMRWGGTSAFTWVRPLRRILCLLDGAVVRFDLRDGDDDGHGLASGDVTEGHRFLAPGSVVVSGVGSWQAALTERFVVVDPVVRRARIADGLRDIAVAQGLAVVNDDGLLDEVTGLVEWPVPLLGRIDTQFMDLPPEVMQVSMRANQRYFALRDTAGKPAAFFGFIANIDAPDGGAAIIAGNERVLRARFSDARHFWDLDRKVTLASRVAALDTITFHAKLGSQGARVTRLERLASYLAPLVGADAAQAKRAAHLAKADLTTGMVGEFPELQGVMGGYYAAFDGENHDVVEAISRQYQTADFTDSAVLGPVALTLALADRLDQLAAFFGIGERPSGSGDPFALRRAAFGIIAHTAFFNTPLHLRAVLAEAARHVPVPPDCAEVFAFIVERLRVFLRSQGERHDVLAAVFAVSGKDDLAWLVTRTRELSDVIAGPHGPNLLAGYRRAANILGIENRKDGPHEGLVLPTLLEAEAERDLFDHLRRLQPILKSLEDADGSSAMELLAALRPPLDRFFAEVLVNDPNRPDLRLNRLRLIAEVVRSMNMIADFSKIDG